jgi:2,3-bisphosphoglycerate-independent phosphoglycerate mutase
VQVSGYDYSNLYEKIESKYASDVTDEFLTPIIINKDGLIKDNDTLMFFNFRSDRMRQITETFGVKLNFEPKTKLKNLELFTMNQYKKEFPFKMLYPPIKPVNVLAEAIGKAKVGQFHCAETEKYAHVTFFFNGGQEAEFEGEVRKMVPSPKVATYDLDPKMNAAGVAEEMCKAIEENRYQFVMCNFAPPDMVGHTGKYEPTVIACEVTVEQVFRACFSV